MAQKARHQLDTLGATSTKITVTNDLDEYAIAALATAPVGFLWCGYSFGYWFWAPYQFYGLQAR